jgi:Xaa-Pro aminopeptidase
LRLATPISPQVCARRRERFREHIGEGVVLIPGARLRRRHGDVDYVFRQHSDLLYLTGFEQPEATALLTQNRYLLFVQPRNPEAETWTGLRPGVEGACERYGADEAHPIGDLAQRLPEFIENAPRLYYPLGEDRSTDALVVRALEEVRGRARRGVTAPRDIADPRAILHEMRLHKEPEELELMRAAAEITREAHEQAARRCQPGIYEHEVEAELHYVFRSARATTRRSSTTSRTGISFAPAISC